MRVGCCSSKSLKAEARAADDDEDDDDEDDEDDDEGGIQFATAPALISLARRESFSASESAAGAGTTAAPSLEKTTDTAEA